MGKVREGMRFSLKLTLCLEVLEVKPSNCSRLG
jgi:hypothetical protein